MPTPAAKPATPLTGYGFPLHEPQLDDVLRMFKTQLLIGLNCTKVGTIVAFYPSTHTADVQILFQRVMKDGTTQSYPKLVNRPVFTLQGGGASLQLPIAAGDTCLVLFADRNLDNWYLNGNEQRPIDGRLHDFTDGIVFVGLNWQSDATIPAASTSEARLILKDGTTKVGLKSGKVTVQNAGGSLLTALNNLVTALNTLNSAISSMTTASIVAGTPQAAAAANATAIAAVTTALTALLY